jgi:uncharacterized protein YbjT (DUF2867 family)
MVYPVRISFTAPGDSIQSVDLEGQLGLVQAASTAGVRHFVFISFPEVSVQFPLQDAKRAVERALVASGMSYTINAPAIRALAGSPASRGRAIDAAATAGRSPADCHTAESRFP